LSFSPDKNDEFHHLQECFHCQDRKPVASCFPIAPLVVAFEGQQFMLHEPGHQTAALWLDVLIARRCIKQIVVVCFDSSRLLFPACSKITPVGVEITWNYPGRQERPKVFPNPWDPIG
jgi:hypothetical protein